MKDFKEGFAANYGQLMEQYSKKPRNVTMPVFQNKRNSLLPVIPGLEDARRPAKRLEQISEDVSEDFVLYGKGRDRIDTIKTVSEL